MEDDERHLVEQIDPEEARDLLIDLINAPSAAPEMPEEDCARVVAKKLREAGVNPTLLEVEARRPNLLAEIGDRKGRSLLLTGHLDTVGPGEHSAWSSDPFVARLADGCVFGRGASDNKGGVAAATLAFLAVLRVGGLPQGRLLLAAVMGEETGNLGMRHLLGPLEPLDGAIVSEWTGAADVAIGNRGALWVELKTVGRAAHGARPEEGVNAIDLMTEQVLPAIKSLPWTYQPDPLFTNPHPTVNVGRIEGGDRVNVVADTCTVLADFRLVPGLTCEGTLALIRRHLEDLQRNWEGGTVSCRPVLQNEPYHLAQSEDLFKVMSRSVEDVTGRRPQPIGKTGFSDANVLVGAAGIPSVTFGPGNSSGHGPNEFVELDQVVTSAKAIALTALRFTQGEI